MTIFLAEDNPADVYLLKEALGTNVAEPVEVLVAQDGEEALDFVHGRGRFQTTKAPDLIVLDLNLRRATEVTFSGASAALNASARFPSSS